MYRAADKSSWFADHLTNFNSVTLGYQRLARSANVLLKRNNYTGGLGSNNNGQTCGYGFAALSLVRVNSAGEIMYDTHRDRPS